MGLDRAPIEFQTFYFFHVWLDPPNIHPYMQSLQSRIMQSQKLEQQLEICLQKQKEEFTQNKLALFKRHTLPKFYDISIGYI